MTIVFAEETFAASYPDGLALLQMHYEEIAPYQDLLKLNVDEAFYQTMEKSGLLRIVTARDDGKLIGYFVMFVRAHIHYRDTVIAQEDIKFVHPEYRGRAGLKLIQFAESVAQRAGAHIIIQRSKAKSGHGALYRRLGYDLLDEIYSKRLDMGD